MVSLTIDRKNIEVVLAAFKKNKNVFNLDFVMKALQNDQQLLDELRRLKYISDKKIKKHNNYYIIIIAVKKMVLH
jgi:ligand-binding sensor protein